LDESKKWDPRIENGDNKHAPTLGWRFLEKFAFVFSSGENFRGMGMVSHCEMVK
jgi:hypothetical protein